MIYIHVPFCRTFCTYCDFYSEIAGSGAEDFRRYGDELCGEILCRKDEIARTRGVHTLYIGGGTPSVLPLSCVEKIVGACREADGGGWEEFTFEMNPDDVSPEYVAGLKRLGVNRVSMGVQSMDDCLLRWMNRRHDAQGARRAYEVLRGGGMENVSLDLIFGIRGSDIRPSLEEMIGMGPEHISAYQLGIEEGSALGRMVREGRYREADEDFCRSQYEEICSVLSEAGYRHYEISNWAKPGFEARHNSAYWDRSPYVGVGPGAHSFSIGEKEVRSWNSESLSGWTENRGSEVLSSEEIREEKIMLGLRRAEGIEGKAIPEKDWFVADTIIADYLLNSQE
ncbi:MAG: radical SAM family heme chaperone HemW [Bacteroidales bacterium]|nr:radical SAM family heme chaperone HemW [Bacteroidales bacterium]